MKVTDLNLSKYKRFFAFGCSFTDYHWPTWADIIGKQIPYYENWGRMSGGNQFIFNSIIECDAKHHFNHDDLVIVMWTSIEREDRYLNNDWLLASHIERDQIYGVDWVNRFGKERRGCLIRDLAVIRAAQQLLKFRNCQWANFSMGPISKMDRSTITVENIDQLNEMHHRYIKLHTDLCQGKEITEPHAHSPDVLKLYKEEFKNIEDSVLNVVFKGEWAGPPRPNKKNGHPTPKEHLQYLQHIYPNFTPNNDTLKFIDYWEDIVWNLKNTDRPTESFKTHKVSRL
jgi:hypothetical protein